MVLKRHKNVSKSSMARATNNYYDNDTNVTKCYQMNT